MDNVNYNFEIVKILYKSKEENNNSHYFNKPIILMLMAMTECMMYDFIDRINGFRWDSFPNITSAVVLSIRSLGKTDVMKKLIKRARITDLFQILPDETLYDDLDYLNQVRNRIHIQNRFHFSHKDESRVFTNVTLQKAEKSFKNVCEILCNVYPRWDKTPLPMSNFPDPWS
ncbi:hypothetical protein ACFL1P_01450 [Patescibacteria group bacterium]